MKPATRWWLIGGGAVAIVALFVLLRPDDEVSGPRASPSIGATTIAPAGTSPTETPGRRTATTATSAPDAVEIEIEVEVEDGRVEGPGEVEVVQGERVRLVVETDVADEVHVHGYDLFADATLTRPAVIVFRADAPGVYEVELEGAGLLLLQLSVVP